MALEPHPALLSGRKALVTGSAAGLGKAVALAFARFGADVAVCDRDDSTISKMIHRKRIMFFKRILSLSQR